jgi:hypothetical protein
LLAAVYRRISPSARPSPSCSLFSIARYLHTQLQHLTAPPLTTPSARCCSSVCCKLLCPRSLETPRFKRIPHGCALSAYFFSLSTPELARRLSPSSAPCAGLCAARTPTRSARRQLVERLQLRRARLPHTASATRRKIPLTCFEEKHTRPGRGQWCRLSTWPAETSSRAC